MKSASRLITNVRRFFGFCRGLTLVCAALIPFVLYFAPAAAPTELGEVFFHPPRLVVENTATGGSRMSEVHNLRGNLSLTLETPEERRVNRIVLGVTLSLDAVLAFLVCHWIWRLCRNVESGEIFTAGNLRLVRRLGVLLIADALVSFAVRLWAAHTISAYVSGHLSFRGLEVAAPQAADLMTAGEPSSAAFAFNQIVIGLLVLCLTAVFRQGLKLQQDAELTV